MEYFKRFDLLCDTQAKALTSALADLKKKKKNMDGRKIASNLSVTSARAISIRVWKPKQCHSPREEDMI